MERVAITGEYMNLCGRVVHVHHDKDHYCEASERAFRQASLGRKTLFDVYRKPSQLKQAIYRDWLTYFIYDVCAIDYGVFSYDRNIFTLWAMIPYHTKKPALLLVYSSRLDLYVYDD